jgi:hypothetical protein
MRTPARPPRKIAALVVGLLAVVIGLVWMGQGSGYFPYPKASFMIDQRPWIWWGLLLAAAGAAALFVSRRL